MLTVFLVGLVTQVLKLAKLCLKKKKDLHESKAVFSCILNGF